MEEKMSRKISYLAILMMALMLMFTVSCEGPEGPAGPAGEAGPAGADAQVTCLSCHNDATMLDNQFEMARSQHGLGDLAVDYAGGRASCSYCHSHEGFVEWATTGENPGNYTTPSPWQCSTCHGLHTTFDETFEADTDYALRKTNAVTAIFDATVTMDVDASSNLCVNCHQARTNYTAMIQEGGLTARITSTHAGPHHGPQANLLLANNGSSAGTPFSAHLGAGCVGCHMYETTGDEEMNVNGGHTFWAAAEKCNACHEGPDVVFDASRDAEFEHEPYYDYKGFQTEIAEKLENLAGLLLAAGVFDSTHTVVPGTYSIAQYNAFWNYTYIAEDRSHGVHSPYYAEELLNSAITGLGGTP